MLLHPAKPRPASLWMVGSIRQQSELQNVMELEMKPELVVTQCIFIMFLRVCLHLRKGRYWWTFSEWGGKNLVQMSINWAVLIWKPENPNAVKSEIWVSTHVIPNRKFCSYDRLESNTGILKILWKGIFRLFTYGAYERVKFYVLICVPSSRDHYVPANIKLNKDPNSKRHFEKEIINLFCVQKCWLKILENSVLIWSFRACDFFFSISWIGVPCKTPLLRHELCVYKIMLAGHQPLIFFYCVTLRLRKISIVERNIKEGPQGDRSEG